MQLSLTKYLNKKKPKDPMIGINLGMKNSEELLQIIKTSYNQKVNLNGLDSGQ